MKTRLGVVRGHKGVVSSNPRFRVWGVNWAVAPGLPRWGPGFEPGPGQHWLTRLVLKWWLVVQLNHYHCGLKDRRNTAYRFTSIVCQSEIMNNEFK